MAESIANAFTLIKPIMNTLLNYDNIEGLKNLIIYIFESIVCYIIVLFFMSKIYLKGAIGTTINSNRKRNIMKELKLKDFRPENKYKAYLLKEIRTMARTPIFLIQCIIMPIVYPILVFVMVAACVVFASNFGVDLMAEFYTRLQQTYGQAIFLAIGQVFYMMNFCSIISVSRESKNAIVTKYIPISLTNQFKLKISIGILINMVSTILVTICYYYCTKNIIYTIIIFAILVLLNLICEKFKILIDLNDPKISWDNEYTMMKQNANIMSELFYTLAVIAILTIISFVIKLIPIYLLIIFTILFIINMSINRYVSKDQNQIFRKVF